MTNLEKMELMMLRKPDDDAVIVPKTMDNNGDSTIGTSPHSGDHGEGSGYDSSVDNGD